MSVNVYKGSSEGLINVGGGSASGAWIGTQQEWNNLPAADKAKYDGKEVIITDDYESSSMYTETHTVTVNTSSWNAYLTYADFNITLKKPLKDVANTKIFMQVMDSDMQAGGHCIKDFTANTVSGRIISGYNNTRTETFDVVLLIVTV